MAVRPKGADVSDNPAHPRTESAQGDILPDDFQGEIATVYNVRDRGLVIISSCGHSGIVNTIKHVQAVTGIEKVHAVVGGIHLAAAPDAVVAKTADVEVHSVEAAFSNDLGTEKHSSVLRMRQW
jgi:metal-dependent hydrolase (beta-lactamase superfamily II)